METTATAIVYEYVSDNSQKLEDVVKWCNERSAQGWEFVQCIASPGNLGTTRWLVLHRRPRTA